LVTDPDLDAKDEEDDFKMVEQNETRKPAAYRKSMTEMNF